MKWGAENADNIYHFSKIRSDLRYRISGRRNTATAFLLETKEGYMQLGDVENYSTLDSEAVTVAPDGTFEIILSAEDPGGAPNWVPLHADATQVLIRQYLCDWETEVPAEFEIVCLDTEGESPEPRRPAPIARQLAEAGDAETARDRLERARALVPAGRPLEAALRGVEAVLGAD